MSFLNKLKAERTGKKVDVEVLDGVLDDDVRTTSITLSLSLSLSQTVSVTMNCSRPTATTGIVT